MMPRLSVRLYSFAAVLAACALCAAPARAQYKPKPLNDPATGEKFHIEAGAGYWSPSADITVQSESLGIGGDLVDLKKDLGLTDQKFPDFQLLLRPALRHKFRLQYIPIKYVQTGTPARDIVFNGIKYPLAIPVNSTLDWKA